MMDTDDLVIVEDEFPMSAESSHSGSPPADCTSGGSETEDLAPRHPSPSAEVVDRQVWMCGSCSSRDAGVISHQQHIQAIPSVRNTVKQRCPHNLEIAQQSCMPMDAHPLFNMPHRLRGNGTQAYIGAPQFVPPVSKQFFFR
jgi:hypothetical protein